MQNYRQVLITVVTFIGGLYFFLEYILPERIGTFRFGAYHEQISEGVVVIGTMAIGLGIFNILRVHVLGMLKAKKGWGNSVALLLGLFITLAIEGAAFVRSEQSVLAWQRISHLTAFSKSIEADQDQASVRTKLGFFADALEGIQDDANDEHSFISLSVSGEKAEKSAAAFKDALARAQTEFVAVTSFHEANAPADSRARAHRGLEEAIAQITESAKELSRYHYEESTIRNVSHAVLYGILFPLGATMFSLLAFYMASAAYRTFRIRSLEAVIMMFVALLMILGQIPQGPDELARVRLWLLANLSTPAFRAIFFGSIIAGLAMAVRMWLSLERSPLTAEDD